MNRKLAFSTFACAPAVALFLSICLPSPAQNPSGQAVSGPVVSISGGKVQGSLLPAPGGAVFKGIPFAQPPVGDLRWREPQPVKPWAGVRPATEYGAPCAQNGVGWNNISAAKSSEDCLYLNVWAPEWPARTKKAVMVWIHGGGNTGGSALGANGIEPPFDGARLASHGVVVVTLQYRLGIFGFLGHPELTAESPHHASGGYGILDQIAALHWIHDNIAQFGGDPGNVTVFGQSAGARDTSILLTSPPAAGLFEKAIAESGSPMSNDRHMQTPAQMEQLGIILAQILNAPSGGAIQYLRGLPTSKILAAQKQLDTQLRSQGLSLDVGTDGYAVPRYTPEVYRSGKEAPVPMIFGNNGRDNVGQRIGNPNDTPEQRRAAVKAALETFYGKYPDLLEAALKIYGFSGDGNDVSNYPPYGPVDIQLGTDMAIRCATTVMLGWHSAVAPAYEYEFDAGTASHPPYHSSELDFVFGYLRDQGSEEGLRKLSEEMQIYWTNFAKTGDPNGAGVPEWPKFDVKTRQYLQFSNEGIEAKADLRSMPCKVFTERLNRDLNARKP